MDFFDIIKKLYNPKKEELVEIINSSKFVKNINHNIFNLVIHTGFSFFTDKKTKMSLLYDFTTKQIYRQFQNNAVIPQYFGLLVYKNNRSYFQTSSLIATEITKEDLNLKINFNNELFFLTFSMLNDDKTNLPLKIKTVYNIDYLKKINNLSSIKLKTSYRKRNLSEAEIKEIILINNNEKIAYPLSYTFDDPVFFREGIYFVDENNEYEENYYDEENYNYLDSYDNTYDEYNGTWAQNIEGLSDDFIDDALGGEPDAYWNID